MTLDFIYISHMLYRLSIEHHLARRCLQWLRRCFCHLGASLGQRLATQDVIVVLLLRVEVDALHIGVGVAATNRANTSITALIGICGRDEAVTVYCECLAVWTDRALCTAGRVLVAALEDAALRRIKTALQDNVAVRNSDTAICGVSLGWHSAGLSLRTSSTICRTKDVIDRRRGKRLELVAVYPCS